MDTRGNEIFLRALWGRKPQHRGFDFKEPVIAEIAMGDRDDLVADLKVPAEAGTAEIEVAVLKACVFEGVGLIGDDERRRLRFRKNLHFLDGDFDFAGF